MRHAFESKAHDSAHGDYQILLKWYHDEHQGNPWEEHEGHGIVREARVPKYASRGAKKPGELVLHSGLSTVLFYDYAATLKIARRDGWGISEEERSKMEKELGRKATRREETARSVVLDYEFLRKFCTGDIYYVGYTIEVEGTSYEDSLWGIMSDDMEFHAKEALEEAEAWIEREVREQTDAAARDILTV